VKNVCLPAQEPAVVKALQDLSKRHVGTPTAEMVVALSKELAAEGKK